jgi:hypothetical protein
MLTVDCNFDLNKGGTMSQETLTTFHPTANLIGGLDGTAAVVKFALGHGFGLLMRVFDGLGVCPFAGDLSLGGRDLSIGGLHGGLYRDGLMPKQGSGKCSLRISGLTQD